MTYRMVAIEGIPDAQLIDFLHRENSRRKCLPDYLAKYFRNSPDASSPPASKGCAVFSNEDLVGLLGFLPFAAQLQGEQKPAYFGFGLFVIPEHRRGIGVSLFLKGVEDHPYYSAFGSSPLLQQYNESEGVSRWGECRVYHRYRSKLDRTYLRWGFAPEGESFPQGARLIRKLLRVWKKLRLRGFHPDKFRYPATIAKFRAVTDAANLHVPQPDPARLTCSRDSAFVAWALFSAEQPCRVYQIPDGSAYFAVRAGVDGDLTCLHLVDYRYSSPEGLREIIRACESLRSRLGLDSTLTLSSLSEIDQALESAGWIADQNRQIAIQTSLPYVPSKEKMNQRDLAMFTMADSDMMACFCWD
jgi:hypothetical protein